MEIDTTVPWWRRLLQLPLLFLRPFRLLALFQRQHRGKLSRGLAVVDVLYSYVVLPNYTHNATPTHVNYVWNEKTRNLLSGESYATTLLK